MTERDRLRGQGQGQATWTGLVQENAALRAEVERLKGLVAFWHKAHDECHTQLHGEIDALHAIACAALTKQEEGDGS